MNLVELDRALKQLRLGGIASVLESRLLQAQNEHMAPIDLISVLVSDELRRRADRLLERRTNRAGFRDTQKSLDTFDFDFNKKMNRRIIYELAAGHFITQHEDALFLGPPGTGKSTSPRPSVAPSSSRGTESCIARPTCSSRRSPTPPSTAPGRS
jgi:DNA replication protein DnaC